MKKLRRIYQALFLCILMLVSNLLLVSAAIDDTGQSEASDTEVSEEKETAGEEEEEKKEMDTEITSEDSINGQKEEKEDTSDGGQDKPEEEQQEESQGEQQEESQKKSQKESQEGPQEEDQTDKEAVLERIAGPDGPCFRIPSDVGRFQRSVDNGSRLQVNSVRYDKFYGDVGTGTYDAPQLGMGIKYIDHDNETPDADGKWRYVYCLNFKKSSPTGQDLTYQGGWTSRKIAYCLYYGAMFWEQPCRYAKYSTGDWQLDYFVTQCAIHILNGEFSTAGAFGQIDRSSQATANEKALAKDRINRLVNDANDGANYASFTQDGWFDASAQAVFRVTTPSDFAGVTDGYATGYSTPTFRTAYDLDMKEQITSFNVSVPSGVSVQKKDQKTYADFRLFIKTAQYKLWKLTGKTVTTTVKAAAPKWWGGGIYTAPAGSGYQDCVMWTYTTAGGSFTKTVSFDKKIPKKTFTLNIQKKDAETGEALTGAVFSLWAYDGAAYSKKLGTFTDKGGGKYTYTGVDYTKTKDGRFLIKEDKPPKDYDPEYVLYNKADKENYQKYGGREVQLTADGFVYDGVPDATIFKDPPMTPKADIVIKKTDADTGGILEGAEFKVYEWEKSTGAYKKKESCTLKYDRSAKRYVTEKAIERTEENAGKFRIVETKLPDGYACPWSREIEVKGKGTVTLEFDAPNYPVRDLVIGKKIKVDEITWAHGNPTFLFSVEGTDIDQKVHSYHRVMEFTEEYVKENQEDGYVILKTTISNIPAGEYKVMEETPVMRYVLTDAVPGSSNITVVKKNVEEVNGFVKIETDVTADLKDADGEVVFENHKTRYDKVSHNNVVLNRIFNQD